MAHYLIDTNCFVLCYQFDQKYKALKDLVFSPENTIHILEICIPEVISIFYKKHFGEGKISYDEMRDMVNQFIIDIRANKFMIHPVMNREIIKTDEIWKRAENTFKELVKTEHSFLGAIDAILLALAINLSETKGIKNDFIFITNDTHLYLTAKSFGVNVKNIKDI